MKRIVYIAFLTALVTGSSSLAAGPNCTCRFAGQNFKTGSIMCIRGKLSRCAFVLNNTSWKILADTCPQVKVPAQSFAVKTAQFISPIPVK